MNKFFLLSAVLPLFSLWAAADTPGVTFLFSNGKKASFAFSSKPEIAVNEDGITISLSNATSVSYRFANVQNFYFEENVVETGISQTEGAESVHHVFNYVDGVVTVKGMASGERITVATVNGGVVKAARADSQGNANIEIDSEPAGVYVVSTGSGVSFKMLKK